MKFWDLVEEKEWLAFLGSFVLLVAFVVITTLMGMAISQFLPIDCEVATVAIWIAFAGVCYWQLRR